MTTYSFAAITAIFNEFGDTVGFQNSTVEIVLGNDRASVDFWQYEDFDGEPRSEFFARLFNVKVDGVLVQDRQDVEMSLLSWSGGSGVYMFIENDTAAGERGTALWVEGDLLPATNLSQLLALEPSLSWSLVPSSSDFSQDVILVSGFAGLIGISEHDVAFGNDENNTRIKLTAGNDSYLAGGGNDEVYGGTDNDTLDGGSGFDILYGDEGNDVLIGGTESDPTLQYGNDLYGGAGRDSVTGGASWDDIYGGDGDDTLNGGGKSDEIWGEAGNDSILGGDGNDLRLDGGEGRDTISGDRGSDLIFGGAGRDRINGGRGNDDLSGGIDADRFDFAATMGRDVLRDFDVTQGDALFIARSMVGGQRTLTSAEIFAQYGTDLGDALVFNFDGGGRLLLLGVADVAELGNAFSIL